MSGGGGKGEGEVEEGRDEKRGKGNAGEDSWGREGVELPRERACAR